MLIATSKHLIVLNRKLTNKHKNFECSLNLNFIYIINLSNEINVVEAYEMILPKNI